MVILVCGEQKLETTEQNAQSILYIQKGMRLKGWELPEDSPYQFVDNALIKRANKRDCKGPKKRKGDTGGGKASGTPEIPQRDDTQ